MQWYIHSSSSLEHHNHPPLEEEATLLSQKDLSDKDEQLINLFLLSCIVLIVFIFF